MSEKKFKLIYISLILFLLGRYTGRIDAKLLRAAEESLSAPKTLRLAAKTERAKRKFLSLENRFLRLILEMQSSL